MKATAKDLKDKRALIALMDKITTAHRARVRAQKKNDVLFLQGEVWLIPKQMRDLGGARQ